MTIVLPIIIICCFSYIGFSISAFYKKRVLVFEDLVLFCNILINNISFNLNILKDIVKEHLPSFKSPIKHTISKYLDMLENNTDININSLNKSISCIYLEKRELVQLINFLNQLGKSSMDAQIKLINAFKQSFEGFLLQAEKVNSKNGGLYSKLGFFLGLAIIIVFI